MIREFLIEAQSELPDYLDEVIFHFGQAYNFFWQSTGTSFLFNGNNEEKYYELDNYLKSRGYKFKNSSNEIGGYTILKNKNLSLAMDIGIPPERKFSKNYQSGILSFEIFLASILSNKNSLIFNFIYSISLS